MRVITLAVLAALALAVPPVSAGEPTGLPLELSIPPDPSTLRIGVAVRAGLTRTVDLPTEALRTARRELLAGRPVGDAALRELADHGDGLAALRLAERLVAQVPSADPADIALHGSRAIATGRGLWLLPQVVEALRRLDPATEPPDRVQLYIEAIYAQAWAGNMLALDAVIDLNGDGRLFGALSQATRARIIEAGERPGDGRARLRLALSTLQDPFATTEALALAREDLLAAAERGDPAVRAMAAALLARDAGS